MIATARSLGGRLTRTLLGAGGKYGKHSPDFWLLAIIFTLVMFGTVMVFSASFALGAGEAGGDRYYYLTRQFLWVVIGLIAMLVLMNIDYHVWRRFSLPGMVLIIIVLAALVLVPGVGSEVLGAERWIMLGPLSFQPSELAKLALVLYLADWLAQKGDKVRNFSYGLVPFAILLGLMIGLIMLQPNLGTSALLAAIGISMFLVAGANLLHLGMLLSVGSVAFLTLALGASYRRARILAFLNPDAAPRDMAWQLVQARYAFGSGGLFGVGLGASHQKFSWLFAAHNDAIFAVIGEELGLVGCAFVLLLFAALAWRGYQIAIKAPDVFGTLLAVGIVTWITVQAAINIGGITLTIPLTGVPLPFISYGGTALAVCLAAIGILLNVSRQTVERSVPGLISRPVAPGRNHARTVRSGRREVRPIMAGVSVSERNLNRGGTGVRSVDGRTRSQSGSFGRGRDRPGGRGSNRQR